MWDRWRRWLQWAAALSLGLFGVVAFLLPAWSADQFPWGAGPIMVQTIGAWGIGTAAIAVLAAMQSRQDRILGLNVYLWLFGILEIGVVVAFVDRLQTGHLRDHLGPAALPPRALRCRSAGPISRSQDPERCALVLRA